MARSLKKGPFADGHLLKKVDAVVKSGDKELMRKKTLVLIPSEMQDVTVKKDILNEVTGDVTVEIESN